MKADKFVAKKCCRSAPLWHIRWMSSMLSFSLSPDKSLVPLLKLWGTLCANTHFSAFACFILARIKRSLDFRKYVMFNLLCPVCCVIIMQIFENKFFAHLPKTRTLSITKVLNCVLSCSLYSLTYLLIFLSLLHYSGVVDASSKYESAATWCDNTEVNDATFLIFFIAERYQIPLD